MGGVPVAENVGEGGGGGGAGGGGGGGGGMGSFADLEESGEEQLCTRAHVVPVGGRVRLVVEVLWALLPML